MSYESRMLKDRIIIGVYDKKLQLKLLDGKEQTVQSVIDTCKVFEVANANKVLLDKSVAQVHGVSQNQPADIVNAIARRCYNCGDPFTPTHLRMC